MDWFKSHKALVGIVFTMVAAAVNACEDPMCKTVAHWMLIVGPALAAGGVMNSDSSEKAKQVFVANGGTDQRKQ